MLWLEWSSRLLFMSPHHPLTLAPIPLYLMLLYVIWKTARNFNNYTKSNQWHLQPFYAVTEGHKKDKEGSNSNSHFWPLLKHYHVISSLPIPSRFLLNLYNYLKTAVCWFKWYQRLTCNQVVTSLNSVRTGWFQKRTRACLDLPKGLSHDSVHLLNFYW